MQTKGILNNIGLKFISFAIALTLWIFVTYRGQSEIIINVPIEFKNIPKGVEILKQSAKEVSLNISGPDRLLKVLRPSDIRVTVDLSNAKKGESLYYLDKRNVAVPNTIKVQRIEPTNLRVVLDESGAKVIPVKVQLSGEPQRGFKIAEINVNPPSITIEGAKTEINKISILRTEPIDITGLDEDLTQSVRINTSGRNIRTNITEVTVTVKIKKVKG
jgi:YbbR domain-containing protein